MNRQIFKIKLLEKLVKSLEKSKNTTEDLAKEEALAKAPLVFDADTHPDKKPYMEVIRIENAQGEGPYHGTSHLPRNYKEWADFNHESKNPAPGRDLGFEDSDRAMLRGRSNELPFAFENEDQLNKWFSPQELERLASHGFKPVKRKAKKVWSSGKQAFFEPYQEEQNLAASETKKESHPFKIGDRVKKKFGESQISGTVHAVKTEKGTKHKLKVKYDQAPEHHSHPGGGGKYAPWDHASYWQHEDKKITAGEALDKGAARRIHGQFDPLKELGDSAEDVRRWVGGYGSRDTIPNMSTSSRHRSLNKLMSRTEWRKNKNTGEREYLLHRQMGGFEFPKTVNNDIISHKDSSSWTPDIERVKNGIYKPTDWSNLHDYQHIVSAWIPESKIKNYLPQYGLISGKQQRGKSKNNDEHEVVVGPHSSKIHSVHSDLRAQTLPSPNDKSWDGATQTGLSDWKWTKIFQKSIADSSDSLQKAPPAVSEEYEDIDWPKHPLDEGQYVKEMRHKDTGTIVHVVHLFDRDDDPDHHTGSIYYITDTNKSKNKPIARVQVGHLNQETGDEYDPHFQYALTDPEHRGKGLNTILHLAALKDYGQLKSDYRLSPGSQATYEKLSSHPNVKAKIQPQESFYDQDKNVTVFPQDTQHELKWQQPQKQKLAASEDQIPGGLADKNKKKPSDFPKHLIEQGRKVEMEHTSDPKIAEEIAADHLTEDLSYYDKLKTIEKKPLEKAPIEYKPTKDNVNTPILYSLAPIIQSKRLPNGLIYLQTGHPSGLDSFSHQIIDPSTNKPLAEVITRAVGHPDPNETQDHKIVWSQASPEHKGLGLGKQAYLAALVHGKGIGRLLSDYSVSKHAQQAWKNMQGLSGIQSKLAPYATSRQLKANPYGHEKAIDSQHLMQVVDKKALNHAAMFPRVDLASEQKLAASEDLDKAGPQVNLNPEHGKIIADAYENMKHDPNNPEVKAAYDALIHETKNQFKDMLDSGIKISKMKYKQDNPYPTSKHLHADVDRGHMWWFPTEYGFGSESEIPKDHPMLNPTEFTDSEGNPMLANDLFRVVHDKIHHKLRNGFGPKGEHEAYLEHKKMYSPLAQKALATETMGQNSYVNFSSQIGHLNQKKPGSAYAPQKAGILPDSVINGKWHE